MSEVLSNTHEDRRTRQQQIVEHNPSNDRPQNDLALHSRLLSANNIGSAGNASIRAAAMQSMQQMYGNRAVQRFVQRVPTQTIDMEDVMVPAPRMPRPDMDFTNDPEALGMTTSGITRLDTVGAAPVTGTGGTSAQTGGLSLSSVMGGAGLTSSIVGVGTGLTQHSADLAHLGRLTQGVGGFGPVSDMLGRSNALANMSSAGMGMSRLGRAVSTVSNISGGTGVASGLYNAFRSDEPTAEDRARGATHAVDPTTRSQGIADAAANAIGFAGPLGRTFSTAYSATQLVDQATGNRISGGVSNVLTNIDTAVHGGRPAYQDSWANSMAENLPQALGGNLPNASMRDLHEIGDFAMNGASGQGGLNSVGRGIAGGARSVWNWARGLVE